MKEKENKKLKEDINKLKEKKGEINRNINNEEDIKNIFEEIKNVSTDTLQKLEIKDLLKYSDVFEEFIAKLRKTKDIKILHEKDSLQFKLDINTLCVICQSNPKTVLFLPCKHCCACKECCLNPDFNFLCPICRCKIEKSVEIYQ